MSPRFSAIESRALGRKTPGRECSWSATGPTVSKNPNKPCQHSLGSSPMFPHKEHRPTAAPDPDTPTRGLCVSRSSRICCRLGGTVCSRRSSHAISVHCVGRKLVSRPIRGSFERLLPKFLSCLEAFVVCDREHAEKTLSASEVVIADGSIVLLPCRVKNIYLYFFAVENHLRGEH